MIRHAVVRTSALLVLLLALLAAVRPAAAAEPPPTDRTLENGWAAEGYIDPGYEAERAQLALDGNGQAVSVWSGRLASIDQFQLRWSQLTGTAWSASTPMFAPTTASERLPQLSRAADGTVWLAWLRDNNGVSGSPFRGPALLAARLSGGAWSLPETVAVDLPVLNEKAIVVDFSILAVSHDEAWLTWGITPDGDPFSGDRDLMYSVHSAAGWSLAQTLSNSGLAETHPVLVETTTGNPVAFFEFNNAPSLLRAVRWTGPGGWSQTPDDLTATGFFGFDAVPDTNGAVRLVAILRKEAGTQGTSQATEGSGLTDQIREWVWNDTGFHGGLLINSAPVLAGGENDPPDWSGVAIASGHECPMCAGPANDLAYRVLWIDSSQSGAPKVLSTVRDTSGYNPYELVGTSFERALAFPNSVHDVAQNRWYATWTAPPSFGARLRAKFSFTQEFAGDLGIGASFVSPDTVRVTVVCSGDATGRVLRLYRLNWPAGQGSPPFSPPVPVAAVPLPGNPFTGPCPLVVDDFPGEGRWFYYVELEQQGTFPARDARSFNAAIVPQGGGGGSGEATRTALLTPWPNPAHGSTSLPFDLVTPGTVIMEIRNLRGLLVRSFNLGSLPAGEYRAPNAPTWTGKTEDGGAAPGGMYFVSLLVDGKRTGSPVRVVYLPVTVQAF